MLLYCNSYDVIARKGNPSSLHSLARLLASSWTKFLGNTEVNSFFEPLEESCGSAQRVVANDNKSDVKKNTRWHCSWKKIRYLQSLELSLALQCIYIKKKIIFQLSLKKQLSTLYWECFQPSLTKCQTNLCNSSRPNRPLPSFDTRIRIFIYFIFFQAHCVQSPIRFFHFILLFFLLTLKKQM